jgi:hypothetical protein
VRIRTMIEVFCILQPRSPVKWHNLNTPDYISIWDRAQSLTLYNADTGSRYINMNLEMTTVWLLDRHSWCLSLSQYVTKSQIRHWSHKACLLAYVKYHATLIV